MAVCFGSAVAHAQTSSDPPNLFEEVSTGAASTEALRSGDLSGLSHSDFAQQAPALQSVTAQQFEALQNTPGAVQTRFVRIPIRSDLDGLTALTANVGGKKFIATLDRVDVLSAEAYAWEGTIRVGGEAYGTITLVNEGGKIAGAVRLDDFHFQVRALKDDLYALTQIDLDELPREVSGPDYDEGSASAEETEEGEVSSAPRLEDLDSFAESSAATNSSTLVETQRVLVLYTSRAENAVADIDGTISLMIQEANQTYDRSRVFNINLELAAKRSFTFGPNGESSVIANDVARLRDDTQVQAWRNQYNADVVVLLTDGNYRDSRGRCCVVGRVADVHPDASEAYAIVDADAATSPIFTFTHEVGHLQSAQHHPDDGVDNTKPYSYGRGHRFRSRKRFIGIPIRTRYHSTAMAYTSVDGSTQRWPTIHNFSNPDVEHYDVDTGTADRNNARVLRATARRVATFRGTGAMTASVSRTNTGNHYTFRANTSGATGTLTYEWYRSLNSAGNYGGVVSRQQSYPTMIYPDNILYVKVIVRSSAGQVATAYGSAYSPPSDCDDPYPPCNQASIAENALEAAEGELMANASATPETFALHAAYPNPFNPTTEIGFDLPEASNVRLVVYDVMGREVARLAEGPMNAGTHRVRFEAAGLPSGVYLYRLEAGAFAQTERMTLVK